MKNNNAKLLMVMAVLGLLCTLNLGCCRNDLEENICGLYNEIQGENDSIITLGDSIVQYMGDYTCQNVTTHLGLCMNEKHANYAVSGIRVLEHIGAVTRESILGPAGMVKVEIEYPSVDLLHDETLEAGKLVIVKGGDNLEFSRVATVETEGTALGTRHFVTLQSVKNSYPSGAIIGEGTMIDMFRIARAGGDPTQAYFPRVVEPLPANLDTVVMNGGSNDILETVCAGIEGDDDDYANTCIQRIHEHMIPEVEANLAEFKASGVRNILYIGPYILPVLPKITPVINEIAEVLGPSICSEAEGCIYLDMREVFDGRDYISCDQMHPTPEGARQIALKVCETLAQIGKAGACSCLPPAK